MTLEYQSTRQGSKGLFTLDNLWDGLGALTVLVPDVRYYFGKMTMYPSYDRYGRDMILYFLKKHFEDKDRLIVPIHLAVGSRYGGIWVNCSFTRISRKTIRY